jgi:hypothetical protein
VSIKASWLRDAKVDMEALTEASFTTHKSGDAALAGLAEDEQVSRAQQHVWLQASRSVRQAAAACGRTRAAMQRWQSWQRTSRWEPAAPPASSSRARHVLRSTPSAYSKQ